MKIVCFGWLIMADKWMSTKSLLHHAVYLICFYNLYSKFVISYEYLDNLTIKKTLDLAFLIEFN